MQLMNERAGLICATIANVNRDPKQHPAPYNPSDFVKCGERKNPEKPTLQTLYDRMKSACAIFGGK